MEKDKNEKSDLSLIAILILIIIVLAVAFVVKRNKVDNEETQKVENYSSKVENIKGVSELKNSSVLNNKVDNGMLESNDEIDKFNSQFKIYQGDVQGSKIKTLIATIISQNTINKGININKVVNVEIIGIKNVNDNINDTGNLTKLKVAIENDKQYNVSFKYVNEGYISNVIIKSLN